MTLNLIAFTVMMAAHDLNVMLASIFAMGGLSSLRVNVGFLYFMEMMPRHT